MGTGAIVRMLDDGTVAPNTGAADIGQGSDTGLARFCAETLRVPVEMIGVAIPDADRSPCNWGSTASRVTCPTGRAPAGAATAVPARAMGHAAEMPGVQADDPDLRDGGRIAVKGQNIDLPFAAVSARAHRAKGGPIVEPRTRVSGQPTGDPGRAVAPGLPFPRIGVFGFGATLVDVEIDRVTGQARVAEPRSALDVGRAINPRLVGVPIGGGFVQGMGFALSGERVRDGARLANPSPMGYRVPAFADSPPVPSIIVEDPEPGGPFGARGAGEIGQLSPRAGVGAFHATAFPRGPRPCERRRRLADALSAAGTRVETPVPEGADHLGASCASAEPDGARVNAACACIRRP